LDETFGLSSSLHGFPSFEQVVNVDISTFDNVLFRRAAFGDEWLDEEPLPDYYAVLKLTPAASVADIRRSFRFKTLRFLH
jgi:hypothetical protein